MPNYDMILKRWESASKMRMWVNEKKKNLSEKVKKDVEAEYKKKKEESPKQEEAKAEALKEVKVEGAEEKKAEDPVKEEEIVLIDTTEPGKVDGMGFTEADKAAIEELTEKRFNDELQAIYGKIVEKAEFLVKLQVPGSYLFQDPSKKKEGHILIIKEPSKDGSEPGFDWKDRLKSWKQM